VSGMEPFLFAAAAASAVAGGVVAYQGSRYEMDVAEQNAVAAKREGTVMSAIEAQKSREAVGRGRALAAASGLSVDGSATAVLGSMAAAGDFSARSAIYNGRRRVQQADADRLGAKSRGNAALINGVAQGATILTSFASPAPATGPRDRMGN
jgi:hypothetical protein